MSNICSQIVQLFLIAVFFFTVYASYSSCKLLWTGRTTSGHTMQMGVINSVNLETAAELLEGLLELPSNDATK